MTIHRTPYSGTDIDWDFFTATFEHEGQHYRAAVVQNIELAAPEYMGNYYVTLQSSEYTIQFRMWQGDGEAWEANRLSAPQAIVNLIGAQIIKSWNKEI